MPADELLDPPPELRSFHRNRVDARGIFTSDLRADAEAMTTFFQAWRRRQAELQAAEWDEERDDARRAVQETPPWIRGDVSRVIETLIDGKDSELQAALDELWRLLEADPELRDRFVRLRVVEDAVEFLKYPRES
jgi:hypothetical protein